MPRANHLIIAASILLMGVGCAKKELRGAAAGAIDMPAAEYAKVKRLGFGMQQWTYHQNQQLLYVRFRNDSDYEVASLTGDVVVFSPGGGIERKPITFDNFSDGETGFHGTMMPHSMGDCRKKLLMAPAKNYTVEIHSATYFPKSDDMNDKGHLFAAICRHDNEVVTKQLNDDKKLSTWKDPITGVMLIHMAAAKNDQELVSNLVDQGVDYDVPAKNAMTPLFMALQGGANDVALYLIDRGANMDGTRNHLTAYELAVGFCNGQVIEKFLAKGLDPNKPMMPNYSPVRYAAFYDNFEGVKTLINHRVDLEGPNPVDGTALEEAIKHNDAPLVKLLLDSGANPNPPTTEQSPYDALLLAAGSASGEIVTMLLKKGANPNVKLPDGQTPLDIAENSGNAGAAAAIQGYKN